MSLSPLVYLPRQSDERDQRNRCTLKNSPTVKGRDGGKSNLGEGIGSGIGRHERKARAKCERWAWGKRDFTVLGHLPKNERGEDRGRLKNIHLSFVCMNVSFLILLLPDCIDRFPGRFHVSREIGLHKCARCNNTSVFRHE